MLRGYGIKKRTIHLFYIQIYNVGPSTFSGVLVYESHSLLLERSGRTIFGVFNSNVEDLKFRISKLFIEFGQIKLNIGRALMQVPVYIEAFIWFKTVSLGISVALGCKKGNMGRSREQLQTTQINTKTAPTCYLIDSESMESKNFGKGLRLSRTGGTVRESSKTMPHGGTVRDRC